MTCIVAYKDKNKMYMGGDGIAANVGTYNTYTVAHPKVFKKAVISIDETAYSPKKFDMLIGYTTSFRMGQILEHNFTVPNFIRKGASSHTSNMEYMVKDFIPALIDCFDQHYYGKKSDAEKMNGGDFIVCFNGSILMIESNFSVLESTNNFTACGCGESYALGALYALELTNTGYDPENMVTEAIMASSNFSGFVNDKITVISTDY